MSEPAGRIDYDVDAEAWEFVEATLGGKVSVGDFLRSVGDRRTATS